MEGVLRGAAMGLMVAVPIGPNAAPCIRQTMVSGPRAGIRCGLGAATVHACYAALAAAGVGGVSTWLADEGQVVRVAGGIFLLGLAVWLFRARPTDEANTAARGYLSTLVVALGNPLTLVTFSTMIAIGTAPAGHGPSFVLGVFADSCCWWFVLAGAVGLLRHRMSHASLGWANRVAAMAVGGFGMAALIASF